MLRQWNGDSNELILGTLKQFGIDAKKISLTKYEALTPDSFIWFFNTNDEIARDEYCLYAEDYIPGLDHVLKSINQHRPEWDSDVKYDLVKVAQQTKWSDASPVKNASVYEPPKKSEELMKYASTSGYDFVFLARAST